MTSREQLETQKRRQIVLARLLGIQHADLVDRAVAEADSEEDVLARLARPPLGLDAFEAEAVLTMQVRHRSRRMEARLRAELAALDDVIAKAETGGRPT